MACVLPITRFFAYLPDNRDRATDEFAQVTRGLASRDLELWAADAYVLAIAAAKSPARHCRPAMLLDVFAGTAGSPRLQAAGLNQLADAEQIHAAAEQSAQCYNLIKAARDTFSLESDALALKPVYSARTAHGHALASTVADLLAVFPKLAESPDPVALYELLCFWVPLAGRTLYRGIRRTPPGGRYHWTAKTGLSADCGRELAPAAIAPYRSLDETIDAIHAAAGKSLAGKIAGARQPLWMALSGGFDSRLIAALLHDRGVGVRAVSFGLGHNEEWHSAQAVAKALGLTVERIAYPPDNTFEHIDAHLAATEGNADPAALSIMPLHGVDAAPGAALLHGFCGDLQAGSHIHRFSSADYASREALADALMRRYYASTRPELPKLFTPAIDVAEVRQDVLSGLRGDCPTHEAYLLWYLENRNRRYVGSQFALLGGHFDMVLPLYDRQLFALWHAVPPIGLANRAVFRAFMAQRYPQLARIAHPEEATAIIPNLRGQLARFARSAPRRVLAKTLGHARARALILRFYRHDDILSLSILAAPQQQARMLARIAELRPALENVLGLKLAPGYESVLTAHLQTLRSLFFVAEYAQCRLQARDNHF